MQAEEKWFVFSIHLIHIFLPMLFALLSHNFPLKKMNSFEISQGMKKTKF